MNFVPEIKNWRTTLSASFALILGILVFVEAQFDGDPETIPDANGLYVMLVSALIAWQGFFGRDARETSETTGVK